MITKSAFLSIIVSCVFEQAGDHDLPRYIQITQDCILTLTSSSSIATFFLPGLVHQFGNMLLAVQGHVLHFEEDGIKRMQELVLDVVQRGSGNLQVVRAILGEHTGATGSAADLLSQVVELGRVPSRECGITLEYNDQQKDDAIWVEAEPFVLLCADTLRRWIQGVPSGVSGVAQLRMTSDGVGGVHVRFGFDRGAGSLPFPLPASEVAAAIEGLLLTVNGSAHVLCDADTSDSASSLEVLELRIPARLHQAT